MDNKEILLDTSVIRDCVELINNYPRRKETIIDLNVRAAKGFKFSCSDMTIFEVVNWIETQPVKYLLEERFRHFICEYEVRPIFKNIVNDTVFYKWLKKEEYLSELKLELYKSFSFSIVPFTSDMANMLVIAVANSLTSEYDGEFYNYIRYVLRDEKEIPTYFAELLKASYIENRAPHFQERVKNEFRVLVIRELAYFEMLKQVPQNANSTPFLKQIEKRYNNKSFNQICKELHIKKEHLTIDNNNSIEHIDFIFSKNYLYDVICKGGSFSINDITDYLNIKQAKRYCQFYYTNDNDCVKKLKRIFTSDNDMCQFLNEGIINI